MRAHGRVKTAILIPFANCIMSEALSHSVSGEGPRTLQAPALFTGGIEVMGKGRACARPYSKTFVAWRRSLARTALWHLAVFPVAATAVTK